MAAAGAFVALALVLLALPLRYREALAHGVRSTVLLPFFTLQRGTADREGRYEDAASLRAQRDSLAAFLVGQAGLAAENRALRALIGFKARVGFPFIPAEATHMSGPGRDGTMLLSVGTGDGARDGMPVVTAEGLVGMVRQTDGRSAVAIDWTNPEFRASVTTVDGRTYGIAEPHDDHGRMVLEFAPNALHATPDSGALMVTSGDGQTYPRGIPVGKVARGASEQGSWQKSYYIEPLVSPTQATHVLLLGQPTAAQSVSDLAAAWGIRLTGAPPADTGTVGAATGP
ncbi:MAG: rod shape-determining protein, partial [Gemmatimonadetes bacterium]|nr:rod shape-determining protein [Gemmatimonadota bacterium]